MKRLRLLSVLIFILVFALTLFVGCKKEDYITSVAIKDHDPATVIETSVGVFDYSAYTLVVSYASGTTEELPLSQDMLSGEDIVKLYREGEHELNFSYEGFSCSMKILVKRSDFGEISFPENNVFTYDGSEHIVEVEGDLPANAVVTYPGGNGFVNAGTYDVTAIVSCDGYVSIKLSTTVKIERAKYDMSGVKFESGEFVYDGKEHKLAVTGDIPNGLSDPRYTINEKNTSGAIDVGEYKVIASFTNNDPNYEDVASMEATLTITQAEYTVNGVEFIFKGEDGKLIDGASKVYDGYSVIVDINDYNKVPSKVSVSFTISDEAGNVISQSNKLTNIVDAGIYTITAHFTPNDSKNYMPIAPLSTTFEVKRADYILSGITLGSASTVYDGNEHAISIEGILPADVTVSYEYYLSDTLVTDAEGNPVKSVSSAGRYTVKAIFAHTDKNRSEIEPLSAVLQITQAEINISSFSFKVNGGLVYDGAGKWLSVDGEIPQGLEVQFLYYANDQLLKNPDGSDATAVVDAGTYNVFITFIGSNPNYLSLGLTNYELVIEKATIDVSGVAVVGLREYTYDGNSYIPELDQATVPANINVTRDIYSVDEDGYRSPVESIVDAGSYAVIYTIVLNDPDNYHLVGNSAVEWYYVINPQLIDVSGVSLGGGTEFTYNGNNQAPSLSPLPEHVSAIVKLYNLDGNVSVDSAINAGEYRCVAALSAENSNYRLSSSSNLVLEFEIHPKKINMDGLVTDSTEFVYDGKPHLPVFVNLPDNVRMNSNLFEIDPLLVDEENIDEAISVGKYRYQVWFSAPNSNYVLEGQTMYNIEFSIKPDTILIANIDELKNAGPIELPYDDKYSNGYYWEDDDETIAAAFANAVFGEYKDYVKCTTATTPKDVESGSYLQGDNNAIEKDRAYEIKFIIKVNTESDGSTHKYSFFCNGKYVVEGSVTIQVKFK